VLVGEEYGWAGLGLLEVLRDKKRLSSGLLSTSEDAGCYPPYIWVAEGGLWDEAAFSTTLGRD
jgi:hypothetical protein